MKTENRCESKEEKKIVELKLRETNEQGSVIQWLLFHVAMLSLLAVD